MFLMSTSIVLCEYFFPSDRSFIRKAFPAQNTAFSLVTRRRRLTRLITKAKDNHSKKNNHSKKISWWKELFLDEDGNWFGLKEDDMTEAKVESSDEEEELSEEERFEAWKRRAEAITELREAQEDMRNAESRNWEDWLVERPPEGHEFSWEEDWDGGLDDTVEEILSDQSEMTPGKGVAKTIRALVLGEEEDDITYEDRVFQYASSNSAKFLALLVIIPTVVDFLVHDFVFMPFLDRYVKTVPLAAEFFDVRRSQKLEMIKTLKVEKSRFRLEAEIGKSPALSDEESWLELRHKALELRDEWRLENRRLFANILSDAVFGMTSFMILLFIPSKVALLKFTGYKIINNISDTGKAFLIILVTDIFLGYHSEAGWDTLIEIILEHYGLEVDEGATTAFVCLVPVFMDACVKLWLFKFLPKLSPSVTNIFQNMTRH